MDAHNDTVSQLVIGLDQASPEDAGRIGVKAANLASLMQAGFDVPQGKVLVTDAYVSALTKGDEDLLEPEVGESLASILAELDGDRFAVRSSSVGEDLAGASFAGQYETVLGVHGLTELEGAVRRCWASADSREVSEYRASRGLPKAPMAVLVQRMVEADAAGVAFSANPVTGRREQVVINAVNGLGDRLVSGRASPDEWMVDRDDARCVSSPEGAIDEVQARAIAGLARAIDSHFGEPQDIEWAIERGQLVVLQARPITVLPPPPVEPIPIDFEVPEGFWQRDAAHTPRAGYHLDTLFFPVGRRATRRWAEQWGYLFEGIEVREFGLWPYLRMVPLGGKETATAPPRWVMWLAARLVPSMRSRLRAAREAVRSDLAGRLIEKWDRVWHPELADAIHRHLGSDLGSVSDSELGEHIDSALALLERGMEIHNLLTGAVAVEMYELATTCRELLGWDLARAVELVSGTSHKSTEPARRLHEIAQVAASKPAVLRLLREAGDDAERFLEAVDPQFAQLFARYLHDYGCRALSYSVAEPTLAEMPSVFLDMIRGQIDRGYDPTSHQDAAGERRKEALEAARAQLTAPEFERFEHALTRAIRAYPVREDNEFFAMSAPMAAVRYASLELGARLAESGVLANRNDVRYLTLEEARASLSKGKPLHDLVRLRKGQRAWAEMNPGPASYGDPPAGPPSLDFLPADARLPMKAILWSFQDQLAIETPSAGPDEPALRGIAASPGTYTGPVRVVMDESDFHKLQPGDVMVCPTTSPVWSVLFPVIGALITEAGGVLSHPAIIAREYQIPAVVATGVATTRLHDGQLVTVDGTSGSVTEAG